MATVREYFDKSAERCMTLVRSVNVTGPDGTLEVIAHVYYDFDAPAKYLGLFLPQCTHHREMSEHLLKQIEFLLVSRGDVKVVPPEAANVHGGFEIGNLQPERPVAVNALPLCEPKILGESLPFTRTVFIYSDNEASEVERALLMDAAAGNKLNLRLRTRNFARERSSIERPLAFISHDSADKDEIARPLALRLQQRVCPVWFDEFTLRTGDSLREKIEKGLKETAKCIVILSPSFLANKRWAKVEFDSIFTREIIEQQNVFLPVWHNVSPKDVYEYSPSLANRKGIDWALGLEEVSRRLYGIISEASTMPSQTTWRLNEKQNESVISHIRQTHSIARGGYTVRPIA